MLSNDYLLSHLLTNVSALHGEHEHELRKLCLFTHAVYHRVSKTTLLWLAISSTFINQFSYFVDNKVVLLSTMCKHYFSLSHFVFESWYTA